VHRLTTQLFFAAVLLLTAGDVAFASQATVELRNSASVEGEVVYLRDVAKVSSDAETATKLGSISLGYSPSIGAVREISIEKVRLAVEAGWTQAVLVTGSQSVRVERASRLIIGEEIRQAIRNEVRRHISSPNFVRLDVPDQIAVPNGNSTLKVSFSSSTNLFQPFSVSVAVEVDGKVFRRFSAMVAIEAEAEIYVAAKDLSAGARISPEDIRLERRKLNNAPSKYLTAGASLKGTVLTKPILAGQEITSDAFMSGVVVRSGDMVKIIALWGAVQLSISGQARSSGKVGERVSVKNLQSDTVIQATVVDEGVVEVRF